MRVVVDDHRIEGFTEVEGFRRELSVISFMKNMGVWTTGSSMCMPSDLKAARQIHACVQAAFEELDKIIGAA